MGQEQERACWSREGAGRLVDDAGIIQILCVLISVKGEGLALLVLEHPCTGLIACH